MRSGSENAHLARAAGSHPRTLGRYRVVTELGRGSTSIVYLGAVNGPAGFNKLFALKLLRPALATDPALVAMFLAEARVGAHLNHPNVVSTLEIDESGPLPFIVMEYLDGQTLQRLLATARIAFKAPVTCNCYFELHATGSTTCKTCRTNGDCPTRAPSCNKFGQEPQQGYCDL